jgi:hypothetical protein
LWRIARPMHCEQTASLYEFPLCLSRACLGKIMHFTYKWLKKCRFLAWFTARMQSRS